MRTQVVPGCLDGGGGELFSPARPLKKVLPGGEISETTCFSLMASCREAAPLPDHTSVLVLDWETTRSIAMVPMTDVEEVRNGTNLI